MKKILSLLVMLVLLVCSAIPVYAQGIPLLPHTFYGAVTINDSPAPVGTEVEARGEGVQTGIADNPIVTTEVGIYGSSNPLEPKLVAQGDIVEGTILTFFVNSVSTGQTAEWHSGEVTELNLTVSIPPVTVSVDTPDEVGTDSDFAANVNISEVTNFDACNYDVSFDASVLRLDNITSGLIGSTTIPVDLYHEMSPGTWRIVQGLPGVSGVSGSGYLAILHFHVIGSRGDNSNVDLSNGTLANTSAEEIPATWIGDSVDVVTPVTVSIDAPDEVVPGSNFTAYVNITEVVEFKACNYDVSFPASHPTINYISSFLRLDAVASGLIGSTTIQVDSYDEISSGTYRVVQNVPELSGVTGSGYLAVLHFHVIRLLGLIDARYITKVERIIAGLEPIPRDSLEIWLSNGMLSDTSGGEIAATWIADSVYVPSDPNGDGNYNALDITTVERIIAGLD